MNENTPLRAHLLLGLFVSLVISLVVLSLNAPLVTEAAETAVMNFSVGNDPVQVGAVTCEHEGLAAATDYFAWCYATLTDQNGYQDVSGCNGTFYRTTSGEVGAADENVRYINDSGSGGCALIGGSGNTVTCNCTFGMKYYADGNIEWTGKLYGQDPSSSDSASGTVALAELVAQELETSVVEWGALTIEESTTFNVGNYTTANNTGNVNMSIQVASTSTDLTCTPSPNNMFSGLIRVSEATGAYTGGQNLTEGQSAVTSAWADNRQDPQDGIENKTVYWAVMVPTGVNGTCTITVNQYAAAGINL